MTIIFVFAVATHPELRRLCRRQHLGRWSWSRSSSRLIPTTIGALLSAIGIAGMDRLVRFNVLAMSGRAVEAAGDVDTLLLDKTGTITLGNRQATEFIPLPGVTERELADAAQLASLSDETPEGRSIVVLAKEQLRHQRPRPGATSAPRFIPFSAQTRISGIDLEGASDPQGRRRRRRWQLRAASAARRSATMPAPPELERCGRSDRDVEAERRWPSPKDGRVARAHPSERHREGRHPRALRRAAPHGHPDHHDHRRQPADRRRHRGRSRRRRFPGRRRRPKTSSS